MLGGRFQDGWKSNKEEDVVPKYEDKTDSVGHTHYLGFDHRFVCLPWF